MAEKLEAPMAPQKTDPNKELEEIESKVRRRLKQQRVMDGLAMFVDRVWVNNQKDMKPVRDKMVRALRRAKGEYDPNKAAAIKKFKGSDAYFRVGENKCRSAVSWLKDIYISSKDLPWKLTPTALPDLPGEDQAKLRQEVSDYMLQMREQLALVGQMMPPAEMARLMNEYYGELLDEKKRSIRSIAQDRCDRAADIIRDQAQEGGWDDAFDAFLYWFVRARFAVIKGPILSLKDVKEWAPVGDTVELVTKKKLIIDVYAPSPFNIYLSKGMTHTNNGNIIELHDLTRQDIYNLIGVPGYSENKVRAVLKAHETGRLKARWITIDDETVVKNVLRDIEPNRDTHPQTANTSLDGKNELIQAMEFYGTVPGRLLKEWGTEGDIDPDQSYQANVWKIGDYIIKSVLNPDSLRRKPIHISSWHKNPNSIIEGEGLIEFAGPVEDAMNACIRALINNMAIASGPLVEIDRDRVDTKTPLYPWRQIESTSRKMRSDGPAVNYYQPQMYAEQIMRVYEFFSQILDDMTVPAYAQGANQPGVTTGTATVFTQLLAAASRSIKAVVSNIDQDIIKPYISMAYDYNMKFGEDKTIKGDATVDPQGVRELGAREQQAQRKIEYLQVAAQPSFSQVLGQENIAAVLADVAKANGIDLPDRKRLEGSRSAQETFEEMLMLQVGGMRGGQANQATGQIGTGGGAPAQGQGLNPGGEKAGTVNA